MKYNPEISHHNLENQIVLYIYIYLITKIQKLKRVEANFFSFFRKWISLMHQTITSKA